MAGEGHAGYDGEHDGKHIVGAERVGAGGHVLEDVVEAEVGAAHVEAVPGVVRLLDCECACGEIDVQDIAVIAVGHGSLQ